MTTAMRLPLTMKGFAETSVTEEPCGIGPGTGEFTAESKPKVTVSILTISCYREWNLQCLPPRRLRRLAGELRVECISRWHARVSRRAESAARSFPARRARRERFHRLRTAWS